MTCQRPRFHQVFLALLLLLAPALALADASTADAEENIDKGLKEFGYLAGLSRGCVAREQEAGLEQEVLDLHAAIGRLLGTDRAFLFAAAFGYGSSIETPTAECKGLLDRFEAQAKSLRTRTGKQP